MVKGGYVTGKHIDIDEKLLIVYTLSTEMYIPPTLVK